MSKKDELISKLRLKQNKDASYVNKMLTSGNYKDVKPDKNVLAASLKGLSPRCMEEIVGMRIYMTPWYDYRSTQEVRYFRNVKPNEKVLIDALNDQATASDVIGVLRCPLYTMSSFLGVGYIKDRFFCNVKATKNILKAALNNITSEQEVHQIVECTVPVKHWIEERRYDDKKYFNNVKSANIVEEAIIRIRQNANRERKAHIDPPTSFFVPEASAPPEENVFDPLTKSKKAIVKPAPKKREGEHKEVKQEKLEVLDILSIPEFIKKNLHNVLEDFVFEQMDLSKSKDDNLKKLKEDFKKLIVENKSSEKHKELSGWYHKPKIENTFNRRFPENGLIIWQSSMSTVFINNREEYYDNAIKEKNKEHEAELPNLVIKDSIASKSNQQQQKQVEMTTIL